MPCPQSNNQALAGVRVSQIRLVTAGAASDHSGDHQAGMSSKEDLQCSAEARTSPASDASQVQRGTAPGQDEAAPRQNGAAQDQMPPGPLFVAQSPAGKGPAEGWVKKYVTMHPECSEAEALRGVDPKS